MLLRASGAAFGLGRLQSRMHECSRSCARWTTEGRDQPGDRNGCRTQWKDHWIRDSAGLLWTRRSGNEPRPSSADQLNGEFRRAWNSGADSQCGVVSLVPGERPARGATDDANDYRAVQRAGGGLSAIYPLLTLPPAALGGHQLFDLDQLCGIVARIAGVAVLFVVVGDGAP